MDRAAWIDAFTMHMGKLGVRAEPWLLAEMGEELWETQGHHDPVAIAQAEFDEWPPHDD